MVTLQRYESITYIECFLSSPKHMPVLSSSRQKALSHPHVRHLMPRRWRRSYSWLNCPEPGWASGICTCALPERGGHADVVKTIRCWRACLLLLWDCLLCGASNGDLPNPDNLLEVPHARAVHLYMPFNAINCKFLLPVVLGEYKLCGVHSTLVVLKFVSSVKAYYQGSRPSWVREARLFASLASSNL